MRDSALWLLAVEAGDDPSVNFPFEILYPQRFSPWSFSVPLVVTHFATSLVN